MPLFSSYCPSYYSIDDILTTQERVPCKFLLDVPKMGKLNPSVAELDILAEINLEVVLWLVSDMYTGRQPVVQPDLPKIYKYAYREIVKADASSVDLQKFNLYFYELGFYCKHFDADGVVQTVLLSTFKNRFKQLMDLANNSVADPLIQHLDTLERRIFRDGYRATIKLNQWLVRSGEPINAANMVIYHKKMKRLCQ